MRISDILFENFVYKKGMKNCVLFFLTEARIDDAKKKYPNISHDLDFFKEIPQKYIMWIASKLDVYKKTHTFTDLTKFKSIILSFDERVNANQITGSNKDINKYKSFDELETIINSVPLVTKTKEKKQNKSNAKLIYKDVRYTIIQPLDKEASCAYGTGTKWCISATKTKNYYDEYASKGIKFYIIIDKSIPAPSNTEDANDGPSLDDEPNYSKVAIAVHEDVDQIEIYDATDQEINKQTFMKIYPKEILDILNPLTKNQFIPLEEKARNQADQFLKGIKELSNLKQVKQFLYSSTPNFVGNGRNLEETEQNEGYEAYEMKMDIIFKEIPINLLPVLYSPDGGESSLQNLGFQNLFEERLINDNVPIDQIFKMFESSISLYKISEDEFSYSQSVYITYLRHNSLNIEDLKKMLEFNPFNWEHPPFKGTAINKYLLMVAKEIGIKPSTEEFIELRNFINSQSERNFIKRMSELMVLSPEDPAKEELVDMIYNHKQYSTISANSLKKMAEIYRTGKLDNLFTPLFGQEFSF